VSYKWGGKGEEIVNQIEQALQARGLRIIRDKRDLGYKGSIHKFMERIGQGNCVIVVIDDAYLRSNNCMFELMEIAEAKQFHDRTFPVVLNDANIYDTLKRIEYVKYWELKRAELAEAMKTLDPANLQGIRDDIDLYDRIRDQISRLISTLNDMNTYTPEMHQTGDYQILADAIVERLESKDYVQQETIRDRRLDAAMPKECQVNQTTEVRVLIALTNSKGLRAFLPDYTESHQLIAKGDVEKASAPINFSYDQLADRYLPAFLYVEIKAPDFQVTKRIQQILVPFDKDSGMLTFFITPHKSLSFGRVSVNLYQDKDCTITLGSVTLTTKVNAQAEGQGERSWQLKELSLISSVPMPAALSPDIENRSPSRRKRKKLSDGMQVAIVGAVATILAAMLVVGPGYYLWQAIVSTPIPPTPIPACVTADDILVRLQIWKGLARVATLAPSGRIVLEPDVTVDMKVDFQSVSGKVLPVLECDWENASSANPGNATEGKLLHTIGCNVDYQSGHTKIEDALYLRVSQPSCPDLSSYAFFVFPQ
jgi:hypothetical protein